jgi:hypothetical protein
MKGLENMQKEYGCNKCGGCIEKKMAVRKVAVFNNSCKNEKFTIMMTQTINNLLQD